MTGATIKDVLARRVWDSRGHPTVEVDITLSNGRSGRAIAPAGASRGAREAIDLRDGGKALSGLGVDKALAAIEEKIAPAVIGLDPTNQAEVDAAILACDPSPLKETVGGNACVAASLAALHAGAAAKDMPLWAHVADLYGTTPSVPLPEIQIFGGGAHAGRRVDVQDFMVTIPGATSFDDVMEMTNEIYFAAGELIAKTNGKVGVADEGGWWPVFSSNEEALENLVKAIEMTGEKPGERVCISLDIAASEFYRDGQYHLALEDRALSTECFIDVLADWIKSYPILSIEDPLAETDIDGMKAFTARFGDTLQIVGDDYLVTNAALVEAAARDKACNAVLIKVNQAGTVSEGAEAFKAAQAAGFGAIVSARSGETEDVSISHLSAGLGCGQLKVGSFTRSERMAKWNECLRLQDAPGMGAFAGGDAFQNTWWQEQR